jgi:hypothetical protein
MQSSNERKKQCRVKAEFHYEIAFKSFIGLSDVCCLDPLRVQLERVALCEYQLSSKSFTLSWFYISASLCNFHNLACILFATESLGHRSFF